MQHHHIKSFQAEVNAQRGPFGRVADFLTTRFGSIAFLSINVLWFIAWIIINTNLLPIEPFDPYPFGLLTMIVSLEAIILSIVVLISQNRASHIADVREEMDLQLDVITEKEITKIMELVVKLAELQKIDCQSDKVLAEMLKPIDVHKIERVLEKQLS
ncbi:MAG: hypothetical protein ACD_43C00234G0004 [uncultured bacterium]|nr:MAG: hypothetical protein ACD_43C00234G0004 [uncultured bacterium]